MRTPPPIKKSASNDQPNPTAAAREALRLLAARRIAPTPDNYRDLYNEITGDEGPAEQSANERLRDLAIKMGRIEPGLAPAARLIDNALAEKTWPQARAALAELVRQRLVPVAVHTGNAPRPEEEISARAWVRLLKELLAHLAPPQAGEPLATRLRALDAILAEPPPSAAELHARTAQLMRSWPVLAPESTVLSPMHETLAQLLESSVIVHISDTDETTREARQLARRLRTERTPGCLAALAEELRAFVRRLESQSDRTAEVAGGLLRLLRLLVDNAGELVAEDSWIQGQLEVVRSVVERPNSLPMLHEAEERLKQILQRQAAIRHGIQEAQSTFKVMVAAFIDQVGAISEHTGEYGRKVEVYSARIRESKSIDGLNQVMAELLADTRAIRDLTRRSGEDLSGARDRAQRAEQRIRQLEGELTSVSEKLREDPLTGTLNRRGFDDACTRESTRAHRHQSPLCLALLDADDFKRVNDTLGHRVGDDVLKHLATVVRETVRPNDIVARFGGEEFVVLFPDTRLEQAVSVMVRLQRNLTRRFFLHNNDKLLITFSAGVTPWLPGEARDSVLTRADEALYQAKHAGKNRVVEAPC